jgi:hypothetical protein
VVSVLNAQGVLYLLAGAVTARWMTTRVKTPATVTVPGAEHGAV